MTDCNSKATPYLIGLVTGLSAGAIAGILLAPKSGKETREDLKKLAQKTLEDINDKYEEVRKVVETKAQAIKEAGKKIDKKKYKEIVDNVVDEFKHDAKVTATAAKELRALLSEDWTEVKAELE